MIGFGIVESTVAALVASFIYISLWYIAALRWKRIDIVDSAWGLGFVYVALIVFLLQPSYGAVQATSLALVSLWGLRLFAHITSRNIKKSEDKRYAEYRKKWGSSFALKAYTNIYLVQGLLVVLVSTPVIAILNYTDASITPLVIVGFAIWLFGIVYEAVADYQLRLFLKIRKPGEIMQHGLWKFSRHPNYFGEITCWWGAAIVAISIGAWWGVFGAALITFLIVRISGLPPLEKHYEGNADYQAYKSKTPALVPLSIHK